MQPFLIGQLSDNFAASGVDAGEALRQSMQIGLTMLLVSAVFLGIALRYLARDEASRLERARAAGEPVAA